MVVICRFLRRVVPAFALLLVLPLAAPAILIGAYEHEIELFVNNGQMGDQLIYTDAGAGAGPMVNQSLLSGDLEGDYGYAEGQVEPLSIQSSLNAFGAGSACELTRGLWTFSPDEDVLNCTISGEMRGGTAAGTAESFAGWELYDLTSSLMTDYAYYYGCTASVCDEWAIHISDARLWSVDPTHTYSLTLFSASSAAEGGTAVSLQAQCGAQGVPEVSSSCFLLALAMSVIALAGRQHHVRP